MICCDICKKDVRRPDYTVDFDDCDLIKFRKRHFVLCDKCYNKVRRYIAFEKARKNGDDE